MDVFRGANVRKLNSVSKSQYFKPMVTVVFIDTSIK